MENKTILITGCSSGVGKMLATELSKYNKVIAIARRLERLKEYFGDNSNISPYRCDVSDLNNLNDTLSKIDDKFSQVDVIINCAGIMTSGDIENIQLSDIQYSINVNALAPLEIVKHFLPSMKKVGYGRIINFTSGAPLNNFAGYAAYSSSKAILNSWTITLGYELKGTDVIINLMSPGPVRSEMAPNAELDPQICLPTVLYLLDECTTSGGFYWLGYKVPLKPDLEGVDWLHGIGNEKLTKVL